MSSAKNENKFASIDDWDAKCANGSKQPRVVEHGQRRFDINDDCHVNHTIAKHHIAWRYGLQCRPPAFYRRLQVWIERWKTIRACKTHAELCFCLRSILMVISAIGNTTVLSLLVKRRMRTPSRLDIMLTHLAIADLMVSEVDFRLLFFTHKSNLAWRFSNEQSGNGERISLHTNCLLGQMNCSWEFSQKKLFLFNRKIQLELELILPSKISNEQCSYEKKFCLKNVKTLYSREISITV